MQGVARAVNLPAWCSAATVNVAREMQQSAFTQMPVVLLYVA